MEKEYNCNNIDKISSMLEEKKDDLIFSFDDAGMSPMAEQYYLAAISNLELAARMMKLAHYAQMKNQ